jgi:isoamylase
LYQVGSFIGDSWKEWNGRFRDDVRAFFRGDDDTVASIADRFLGSPAIYGHKERDAGESVNFVTCHDGFTLNDLVSFNQKHNEANGEANQDGANDNRSWNCGVEGPSTDPGIEALRNRQIRNFLTVTMMSLGIPMIGWAMRSGIPSSATTMRIARITKRAGLTGRWLCNMPIFSGSCGC